MTDRPAAVISDANVLIDYINVEQTRVLRLVTDHLFPIKLPRPILDEVDGLTEDQAEALGMEIVEATFDQLKESAVRGGALSKKDKLDPDSAVEIERKISGVNERINQFVVQGFRNPLNPMS